MMIIYNDDDNDDDSDDYDVQTRNEQEKPAVWGV